MIRIQNINTRGTESAQDLEFSWWQLRGLQIPQSEGLGDNEGLVKDTQYINNALHRTAPCSFNHAKQLFPLNDLVVFFASSITALPQVRDSNILVVWNS